MGQYMTKPMESCVLGRHGDSRPFTRVKNQKLQSIAPKLQQTVANTKLYTCKYREEMLESCCDVNEINKHEMKRKGL